MSPARLFFLLILALPAIAEAQRPVRPRPQRPPPTAPQRDTTARPLSGALPGDTSRVPRDTLGAAADDTTVTWTPADSVMEALLNRPGYIATRYEGDLVSFDPIGKAIAIAAGAARHAQVEREGQRVTTNPGGTIVYRDVTREVEVTGDPFEIAPGGGQTPIKSRGTAQFNLETRSGRLTRAEVMFEESGERWFVRTEVARPVLGDTALGIPPRFYGVSGSLTSCDDSIPDYHFQLREIKRTDKTLVARPAVLYIRDIPVMWLPFVFQDLRPGRKSGVLPPRVGASDVVRNNPGYRRHIENIGYYWALNDYMDALMWADWRSATGGDSLDPGWYRLNGEWKYSWMTRFLQGRVATAYTKERTGNTNLAVSWNHGQRFGRHRNLSTNVNYVTSTRLQRQNTFNPYQALATIRSQASYSDKIGPASISLGGTRTQYPGRDQVDQTFPNLSITTGSLSPAPWLVWTPSFSFTENQVLKIDQPGTFATVVRADPTGRLVTDTLERNRYDRTLRFDTPVRIFGFDLRNGVTIRDQLNDFPEEVEFYRQVTPDSAVKETRVFRRTFRTDVDWNPSFSLPPFFQNRFKLTPSVTLENVDPRAFWVRSELTGGQFVHQSKRLSYGLSASPAIFGIWPGVGPFQRFRHAITPTLSYSFAPKGKVSDAYLEAQGGRKQGYLGALQRNAITLGVSQNIEAKVRTPLDSGVTPEGGQKIKLLSMNFSPLSYDFERARFTGRKLAGITTETMSSTLTSDLLPGFNLSLNYSLFQGSTLSDTAEFSPFLTGVSSTLRFSQRENPFAVITRLFSGAVPDRTPQPTASTMAPRTDDALSREIASQPVAGQGSRSAQFVVPPTRGWEADFTFTTTRYRRPRGDRVIEFDPRARCEQLRQINPFAYDECLRTPSNDAAIPSTTGGAPFLLLPAQTSINSRLNFELTQQWAATWSTSYDFERSQFASHIVSLQRDLHDWRAIFSFTQSPNGNFAFNFFIVLKAQQELKFDYSRATIRGR